jgi:hypothetical protein
MKDHQYMSLLLCSSPDESGFESDKTNLKGNGFI